MHAKYRNIYHNSHEYWYYWNTETPPTLHFKSVAVWDETRQAAADSAPRLLGGNVENVGKTRSYVRGMWKLQTVVITIIMSWDITRGGNEISWNFHRRHVFKVNHQWVQTRRTWCEHFAKFRLHLKWATVRSLELVTKLWWSNESVQRITWLVTARLWTCCWFLDKLLGIKISFII